MDSSSPAARRSGLETPPIVERVHAPLRREVRVRTRGASRVVSEGILFIGGFELLLLVVFLVSPLAPPPISEAVGLLLLGVIFGSGPLAAFLTALAIANLIGSGHEGYVGTMAVAIPVGVVISFVSLVFWLVVL